MCMCGCKLVFSPGCVCVCEVSVVPEDGVMGVATSPLTLNAAICCICAAAMAAMGFR